MPTSQQHVDSATPHGAHLTADGATFRCWAPRARAVHVLTGGRTAAARDDLAFSPAATEALVRRPDGTWTGFVPGVADGTPYLFWVAGDETTGPKRDPYARELGTDPPFPRCDGLVRAADTYPWHDQGWRPPEPRDLVLYQLHVGVFHAADAEGRDARDRRPGKLLDLVPRLPYLVELGVNAIQPLPIQEYPSEFSLGYNGTDYFSPEGDYQVEDEAELARYLAAANALLSAKGQPPLALADLRPGPHQLKAMVDLCHLHGIAVIFDVVYNHAGGGFDDASLYRFDRHPRPAGSNGDGLCFSGAGWAGGLVFDFARPEVRRLLIDNALFLLSEVHADGFRYDEVTVIDHFGGWSFAQELAAAVRAAAPHALQIAEYWNDPGWRWLAVAPPPVGMGFDALLADGLREALRDAVGAAARGRHAHVPLGPIRDGLHRPWNVRHAWRAVQHVENHDLVYAGRPPHEWRPRLARLADGSNARSWYARSRSRVATGLVLTAPGIPMLFMGQEVLEDKNWSDNPRHHRDSLIWWDGLAVDRHMRDHLAFVCDLVALRRALPALRGEPVHVFQLDEGNRVLAFHRWVEGEGRDVVVVASLAEETLHGYELGLPHPGRWREAFNSDFYDHLPNPLVAGNGGAVEAGGPPRHGFAQSAALVLPANALVVLARE